MEFHLKLVDTPLFGTIGDRRADAFRDDFAAGSGFVRLGFNQDHLTAVAKDIEVDVEGVLHDARRYVDGRFRAGAEGLSGNRLGDFGEAVAYLHLRATLGSEDRIARIVETEGRDGPGPFPRPDFLIRSGRRLRVVEVKSAEALAFRRHADGPSPIRTWACDRIRERRRDALGQLGFDGRGTPTNYGHRLTLRRGTVPFPADSGEAIVVALWDGRLDALRGDRHVGAPRRCLEAARTCWSCFGRPPSSERRDGALVRMPNAPGFLRLLGSQAAPEGWFDVYQRWTHAVWSRSRRASERLERDLLAATGDWASRLPGRGVLKTMMRVWHAHLTSACQVRGLSRPQVGDDRRVAEPVSSGSFDAQVASRLVETDSPLRFDVDGGGDFSGSVTTDGAIVNIRTWNASAPPGARPDRTAGAALDAFRTLLGRHRDMPEPEYRRLAARVGGSTFDDLGEVFLGYSATFPSVPGARLHVLQDGRASLTVSRASLAGGPATTPTTPRMSLRR
jgi:hypothetical protein